MINCCIRAVSSAVDQKIYLSEQQPWLCPASPEWQRYAILPGNDVVLELLDQRQAPMGTKPFRDLPASHPIEFQRRQADLYPMTPQ